MDCTDRPIGDAVLTNLRGCAADAAAVLALSLSATAAEVVAAVDGFVHRWQRGEHPAGVDAADVPYLFGSLWGEQLVAALGWAWAEVTFRRHDGVVATAVVSPDRALAVYPIHFILECVRDPAVDVTIAVAFDELTSGRMDGFTPGGFANVMDVVQRAVPRD